MKESQQDNNANNQDLNFLARLFIHITSAKEQHIRQLICSYQGSQDSIIAEIKSSIKGYGDIDRSKIVNLILDYNISFLNLIRDRVHNSFLHLAAGSNNPELVKLFIERGGDIEAKNNNGMTALHFLIRHYGSYGDDIMKILIEFKADINSKNVGNITPLHLAGKYNNFKAAKILLDSGADIESLDSHGQTPLLYAVFEGKTEMVDLLIQYKANINIVDSHNSNIFQQAVAKTGYNLTIIKLLIEKGINVEEKMLVDERSNLPNNIKPLQTEPLKIMFFVQKLFEKNGIDSITEKSNINNDSNVENNLTDVINLLGSDIDQTNNNVENNKYKDIFIDLFIHSLSINVKQAMSKGTTNTQNLLNDVHKNLKEAELFSSYPHMMKDIFSKSIISQIFNNNFEESPISSLKFMSCISISGGVKSGVILKDVDGNYQVNEISHLLPEELEVLLQGIEAMQNIV